jgi:hypothetical protein
MHASVEEQLVYPLARKRLSKLEPNVLQALEEHHVMKLTLAELDKAKVTDERFIPKVQVLLLEVETHFAQEERIILSALERALPARELESLGQMIERAKKLAPTRPHAAAPDQPPANIVAGVPAAIFDRARDVATGRMRRGANGKVRGATSRARATTAAKRRIQPSGRRAAHS